MTSPSLTPEQMEHARKVNAAQLAGYPTYASALIDLFPQITSEVCRRYIAQGRSQPNSVSEQIKARVG